MKPVKRVRIQTGKEETNQEIIMKDTLETPVAYVTYGQSVTKNLGNYESAKFNVSISMPCKPENVREVTEDVVKEVVDILNSILKNLYEIN